jgi:hypothetical protein
MQTSPLAVAHLLFEQNSVINEMFVIVELREGKPSGHIEYNVVCISSDESAQSATLLFTNF